MLFLFITRLFKKSKKNHGMDVISSLSLRYYNKFMSKEILFTTLALAPSLLFADSWTTESKEDWTANKSDSKNINFTEKTISPSSKEATFLSILKSYPKKRKATSITLTQSPTWLNWESSPQLGPKNLEDAPVTLRVGDNDYWVFGRYGVIGEKAKNNTKTKGKNKNGEKIQKAKLEGFEIPLTTTSLPNVYDAPGANNKSLGGYHAWQSKDMENWVHHGPVSTKKGRWLTTAERVGDETYFYYDFPNDQDPHLIIDSDLTDGKVGKEMGMAFEDPSDGSDCAVIRSRDGKFHLISENWSVIDASVRSWDSPLATRATSEDGMNFKLEEKPAVDYRTKPTGKFGTFRHPHWTKEDPKRFPGEIAAPNAKGNGVKPGNKYSSSKYEIHSPEQEAYGDWASIAIGGQYYLFGDYDPVGAHGQEHMKTVWFTAGDISEPFKKCGTIGKGHPDPDIIFAEGKFWLFSQTDDFVSNGPWIDGVEVRVGVDTDDDKSIDQWTEWTIVKETYSAVEGFAKQVDKTPAELDLNSLPEGYGFQYEIRFSDKTKNDTVPELDKVELSF